MKKNLWQFTLLGSVPSKKNSRQMFSRGGKIISIPSKSYNLWHEDAKFQLFNEKIKLQGELELDLKFWVQNNRPADLDNKAQSIMDLLQDCEIIENDCWQVVRKITVECLGIDRKSPRVEITVKSLET